MSPIFVRFAITRDEYTEGMRHLVARQPATWVGPGVGVVMLVLGVLLGQGVVIGAGIVLVSLGYVSFRLAPGSRWKASPALGVEQTHVFGDDGVDVRVGSASERFPWGFYAKVTETRSLFVLMRDRKQGNFIPKRAFKGPEDEDRFRELVAARVGPIGR